jgi:rhomboid family GlyGly-CTERM serine protease
MTNDKFSMTNSQFRLTSLAAARPRCEISVPARRIPFLTLLLVATAVAVHFLSHCAPFLVYDRPAILSGEVWRMFTGHWVHFSTRQLLYDLAVLGLAGWILETRRPRAFGWYCALAPWAISAALLVFEPQMRFCGGLSGLATGAMVLLALHGLSDSPPWRFVCGAVLLALAGKTIFELAAGRSVFDSFAGIPVLVSVTSHIAGAAIALLLYAVAALYKRRKKPVHGQAVHLNAAYTR